MDGPLAQEYVPFMCTYDVINRTNASGIDVEPHSYNSNLHYLSVVWAIICLCHCLEYNYDSNPTRLIREITGIITLASIVSLLQ